MKTYLVTGCAGFIGSNFVHYMLEKYEDIRLINLDKLTYAGNLENLQDIEGDARHIFVQGDICDKALVTDLIAKYDPDYVINFAAESHVDRSIKNPEIFVESNVLGTVNLLQCCKDAWYDAAAKTWKEGKKYLQVSTDEVYGALGAEGLEEEIRRLVPAAGNHIAIASVPDPLRGEAVLLAIEEAMGDAARAVFATGEVSFKRAQDGTSLDTKRLAQDHPELMAQYSVTKPGARRFLISAKADHP